MMEEMQSHQLKFVIERDSKDLLAEKIPMLERQRDISTMKSSLSSIMKTIKNNEKDAKYLELEQAELVKKMEGVNKQYNNRKEGLMEEFEHQAMFEEIFKAQLKVKDEDEQIQKTQRIKFNKE
jgi:hypothetical protein